MKPIRTGWNCPIHGIVDWGKTAHLLVGSLAHSAASSSEGCAGRSGGQTRAHEVAPRCSPAGPAGRPGPRSRGSQHAATPLPRPCRSDRLRTRRAQPRRDGRSTRGQSKGPQLCSTSVLRFSRPSDAPLGTTSAVAIRKLTTQSFAAGTATTSPAGDMAPGRHRESNATHLSQPRADDSSALATPRPIARVVAKMGIAHARAPRARPLATIWQVPHLPTVSRRHTEAPRSTCAVRRAIRVVDQIGGPDLDFRILGKTTAPGSRRRRRRTTARKPRGLDRSSAPAAASTSTGVSEHTTVPIMLGRGRGRGPSGGRT
jgi:hypothetical protein